VDPAQEKIMKYTERRIGDVVIVDLKGKATFGTRGSALRQIVGDLLDRGERCILLNMAEVSYMDSGGIGDLVVGFARVSKRSGQLKLLNLTDKTHDLLEMTGLIDVFWHFSDETEAVNSFHTE
jgi:anti-sigma B factor antagonist